MPTNPVLANSKELISNDLGLLKMIYEHGKSGYAFFSFSDNYASEIDVTFSRSIGFRSLTEEQFHQQASKETAEKLAYILNEMKIGSLKDQKMQACFSTSWQQKSCFEIHLKTVILNEEVMGGLATFSLLEIDHTGSLTYELTKFQHFFEFTDIGTWEWNVQTGETLFNEKWANLIGYTLKELQPTSIETWMKFAHPDDLEQSNQKLNEHFEGKAEHYICEARMRHKDGHWIWVLDRGKVITRTPDGKPEWMRGTHLEITRSKNLETQLKNELQITKKFVEQAPSAIAMFNKEMEYMAVSDQWIKDYHLEGQNLIGISHYHIFPEISNEWKQIHQEAINGVSNECAIAEFERADGSIQYLSWSIRPWYLTNNEVGGIIILTEDKSESMHNELLLNKFKDLLIRSNKAAKIGSWEINLKDQEVYWSDVTKEIHEVPDSYRPNLDKALEFYPEGDMRNTINGHFQNAMKTGKSYDVELQIKTAKGNLKWVRAIGIPEFDEQNNCIRVHGLFQDIDEKTKATRKLAFEEERFRQTFEQSPIGMAIVDLKGNWLRTNRRVTDILGYTGEELKKMNFQQVTHPEDLDIDLQQLEQVLAGEIDSYNMEKRYFHKQGHIIWARLAVSLVRNLKGTPLHFVSQIEDITAEKHSQLHLEQTIQRLQGILDASTKVAIIETDLYGTIKSFNIGAENLLGYSNEEMVHQQSLQELFSEDEIKEHLNSLNLDVKGQFTRENALLEIIRLKGFDTRVWSYKHKKGLIIPVQVTLSEIKSKAGDLRGYLAIATDISELKKAEKENNTLLEVTQDQNSRLLNFAHIVSHNLRSHTSNFNMLISLSKRKDKEFTEQEIFPMIEKAATNLSETVEHLNQVVIMTSTTHENFQKLNLKHYIDLALGNAHAIILDSNANVNIDIDNSIAVSGIPAYLESCIHNFITNAIKYRSPKRTPFININASVVEDMVHLSIEDNGLGIDLIRHGHKLFGMYKTFHRHEDARGIGLFITKSQVEAIGGTIEVESMVDKGTKFTIKLRKWIP